MEINVWDLINEVQKRPVLWDRTHKHYYNRFVVEKNWRNIATTLDKPKDALKKRWKNLRDQFRNECKRVRAANSEECKITGEQNISTSCWPYFQSMKFLKEQMRQRIPVGEVLSSSSYCTSDREESIEELLLDEDQEMSDNEEKNVAKLNVSAELLLIEEQKLMLLEKRAGLQKVRDDDESFFDSLLPYVRKMEMNKKLRCRMKIQKIIYAFSVGEYTGGSSDSPLHM